MCIVGCIRLGSHLIQAASANPSCVEAHGLYTSRQSPRVDVVHEHSKVMTLISLMTSRMVLVVGQEGHVSTEDAGAVSFGPGAQMGQQVLRIQRY